MNKINQKLFVIIVIGLLLLMAVFSLCGGSAADFSAAENRLLATKPLWSGGALVAGDYFPAWENWFSDHIWQRERWLQAYVALNMRLGRVAVNEVVLGKQVLLPRIETSYKEWDFREKAAAAGDDLLALDQYIRQRGGSF
ncbi:MAG: hypothetical protein RR387_07980, partial [Clostridiales bacterium]